MRAYPKERFSSDVTLSPSSVVEFANAAGDNNPIHHDPEFAATTRFGRPMVNIRHGGCVILTVLIILVAVNSGIAQTADPELLQLRRQLALYYMEPAPHMALAKYFWQKGDRLQAFYLLEYARRGHLPDAQFNSGLSKGVWWKEQPN